MTTHYYRRFAPALAAKGYNVISIRPGEKRPTDKSWQTQINPPEKVKKLAANGRGNCSVGLSCGKSLRDGIYLVVLDVDIDDGVIADAFTDRVVALTGKTPIRIGNAPRRALFFQASTPLRKRSTEKYKAPNEDTTAQVEILGRGQYVVVEGVHPTTQKPYRFEDATLEDIAVDNLPVIDNDQISEIFDVFQELMRKYRWINTHTGELVGRGSESGEDEDFLQGVVPTLGLSIERIRAALKEVAHRADEYDFWLKIGFALHHEGGGAEAHFQLWDEWSQGSAKYAGVNDLVTRWAKFHADAQQGGKRVTLRSLLKAVKDEQPTQEEILDEWLKRFVLVEEGNRVIDINNPSINIPLREFHGARKRYEWQFEDRKGNLKALPLTKVWEKHKDVLVVDKEGFLPGAGKLYTDEHGTKLFNLCRIPGPCDSYDKRRLNVFFDHMNYLFPLEEDKKWFIQWLAFNMQHPEIRCKVTPLHISTAHRTGRGWLTELLIKLIGRSYCKKTTMTSLVGDKDNYNGYFYRSLVCCIDEVREQGKSAFFVNDKIRDKLTDITLDVNIKFGQNDTMEIFTNFFLMSNHWDALVIPQEDERIIVLSGPDKRQPSEYYTRLYGWLNCPEGKENVDALRTYLYELDLKGFKWDTAPMTEGKRQMIDYSMTDAEIYLNDLLASPPYPVATFQWIAEEVRKAEGADEFTSEINKSQLERLLKTKGIKTYPKKIKYSGKSTRVWALDNKIYDNKKVREILEKQERDLRGGTN